MKKWLIVAGFVGAFAIGSLTAGSVFSYASPNNGSHEPSSNMVGNNRMMTSGEGSGTMGMMGDSDSMNMMGNMNDMMGTMSVMSNLMNDLSNEAAKNLKITTDQLQNELKNGKSLVGIAKEQGIKQDKLVKELQKVIRKDVKQLKKDGQLTTDEQAQMLDSMSENIGVMVNAKGMFACNGFGETSGIQN